MTAAPVDGSRSPDIYQTFTNSFPTRYISSTVDTMTQIDRTQTNSSDSGSDTSDLECPLYQVLSSPTQTLFPQFLLFGDSITQLGCATLQPSLQTLYIRRLDVINRGFGGYTTAMGRECLTHFLPVNTPAPSDVSCIPPIKVLTIFFGANDACLPNHPQHIPLDQFINNIRAIINYPVFRRHHTKVILITTPPINEHQFPFPLQRTAANAARYAAAVRDLANDLGLPCVDIWGAFLSFCGYDPTQPGIPGSIDLPPSPELATLLVDGLHFTSRGYEILYNELMDVIKTHAPDCLPENIPMIFREWREILNCPKKI